MLPSLAPLRRLAPGVASFPRQPLLPPSAGEEGGKAGEGREGRTLSPHPTPPLSAAGGGPREGRAAAAEPGAGRPRLAAPSLPLLSSPLPGPASAFPSQTRSSPPINPPRGSRGTPDRPPSLPSPPLPSPRGSSQSPSASSCTTAYKRRQPRPPEPHAPHFAGWGSKSRGQRDVGWGLGAARGKGRARRGPGTAGSCCRLPRGCRSACGKAPGEPSLPPALRFSR